MKRASRLLLTFQDPSQRLANPLLLPIRCIKHLQFREGGPHDTCLSPGEGGGGWDDVCKPPFPLLSGLGRILDGSAAEAKKGGGAWDQIKNGRETIGKKGKRK